ncbi:MAG: hypothetical protein KC613_16555, partial [Myxococcales bacterium]|nr:hypothetical protein [Myxococcales bacterium]
MSTRWREVRVYLRSVFLVATVAACGQSNGCAGCDPDGPAFPDKDKIHSAVQVRLSAPGVQFLEENVEPLLSQAIPEGLSLCIPGDGGDLVVVQWGYCNSEPCSDGQLGCEVNVGIGAVDLEPIPGPPLADGTPTERAATLRATVTFDELNARFDVRASPVVDCAIRLDAPGFPVSVDLDLTTPDPTRYLTFSLQNPQYRLADLNIRLQGNGGFLSPLCDLIDGALNLPFIGDLIQDLLQGFIDGALVDLLAGVLEDFTCRSCEVDADCPIEEAPRCDGGKCRLDSGACIPAPLGLEGAFDIGELLGGFSPGLSAVIQYFGNPGSYVQVENEGLSVGVIAGAVSERNRCVPRRAQPPTDEPPRSAALRLNESPSGQPFEVGLGIHELTLQHALWAAYNSGALCLSVSGENIEQLSTQFLAIAVPGLRDLAGRGGVMAVTLSPQEVPEFRIGTNTVRADGDGGFELDDPLLTITLPDVWIDFHLFMEGRWARAFSLRADIEIPLGLAFDPDNGVIPVIGDLAGAIRNLQAANDEIVPDGAQRLVQLLPALIGPILNGALEGLADPIALPDIMGYQLNLQEGSVTGIDDGTVLAVFADLERREEVNMGEGVAARVETDAKVLAVHIPPTADFVEDGTGVWRRPFVRLALDAWDGAEDGAEMEYSVRVDDHSWSLFSPSRERVVRSPAFILQGRHTIYVRARRVDDYRTLDPTPKAIEVIIDSYTREA